MNVAEIAGIIMARGGSKSIPQKNIAPLAGKPLIAWTIEAALNSPRLNRLILTTEDEEIAHIGRKWGAEVPFLRPAELARDDTPGIAPVIHAVKWLADYENYRPDFIMLLQPTSPLRTSEDIMTAIDLAERKKADGVVSVSAIHGHPYWMKRVDDEGRLRDFISLDQPVTRRQDLPPVYALNGAIYLARHEVLLKRESWYTDRTYAYVMPPERSLDVDTPWDYYLIDLILKDRLT